MAGLKPLGQVLVARGLLDDVEVNEALERQGERFRLASLCYVLGYAAERPLAEALVEQTGWPAVIFDDSVIDLAILDPYDTDWLRSSRVLPVLEDRRRVVVAVADPDSSHAIEREVERLRGKPVELHIALEVTLLRGLRAAILARGRGERLMPGAEVPVKERGVAKLAALSTGGAGDAVKAHRAVFQEATRELVAYDDLVPQAREPSSSASGSAFPGVSEWGAATTTTTTSIAEPYAGEDTHDGPAGEDTTMELVAEIDEHPTLDGGEPQPYDGAAGGSVPAAGRSGVFAGATGAGSAGGPVRVVVIDGDDAGGAQTARELERLGFTVEVCAVGGEAIRVLRATAVDLIVADVNVPEIDGFRLCRVTKRSRRLGHVPFVLTSSVIDSGPISEEVLRTYGVDAYLEKPLDVRHLHRAVRELLARRGRISPGEPAFTEAMGRYQAGDLDGAIRALREGIDADPTSAKHRFVLANLLQRKALVAEAIDEYETVVELQPDYFPALTRLAYLYYRQGHLARAVETWRRSLPVCDDDDLRRNIELFMRKLIADLAGQPAS